MSGKWASSDRSKRLGPGWPKTRATVLKRDGHQCTWTTPSGRCAAPATEVDHIDPMTDDHRTEALQSLCTPHHKQKTSKEASAARWRYRTQRPPEKHPGTL